MAIKLSSSKKAVKYVKCVIYGDSGVGKTVLGATAPKPIFIDAEAGLLSISDQDIDSLIVSNFDDVEDALDFLYSKKAKKYETVIIDSLSEVGEIVLQHLKNENKDGRQAYMQLGERTKEIIRAFRKLKKNVVFICKLKQKEDDGMLIHCASMPGKALVEEIPYLVDEVFVLRINDEDEDEEYRYLQTNPTAKWSAKDRSGKLKDIEKPDLTHIFKKIKGKK